MSLNSKDKKSTSPEKEEQYKIIPIGSFCGIVMQLKRLELRKDAYPFDWMTCDLTMICDNIEENFKDFFDVTPIYNKDALPHKFWYVYNKYPNMCFGFPHHDMSKQETKETFLRRINKWKTILSTSTEKIWFAHETFYLNMDVIKRFINIIQKYYPKLKFHLIFIQEFTDDQINDQKEEYVEEFDKQELFTIYKIHMKTLEQAIYNSSNKFYDIIFKQFLNGREINPII